MSNPRRINPGVWLLAGLLLGSVLIHSAILSLAELPQTKPEMLANTETIEIAMIEEIRPEPVPDPTPEPTPEATPESTPPPEEEKILTSDTAEPEPIPTPTATPEPTPTPTPTPKPTPKPTPRPTPAPHPVATPAPRPPKPEPPAAPRGRLIEAQPDTASNPPPRYPDLARRNGWEGEVIVRAQVNAAGRVTSASVLTKSRYAVLDKAAVDAVRRWRFRPRTVGGQAVEAAVEVPVNFSLRR